MIAGGIKGKTDISLGVAVSHAADPAVVGPIATTVTDENEIIVFHPGTDVEINPSAITISGGNVTIQIPRCRMVLASLAQTPADGLDYTDTTNFEQTVDVKRIYNDTSTQGELVYPHGKSCGCVGTCSCSCGEDTDTACIYVRDSETGIVDVLKATYSGGVWSRATTRCGCAQIARLNYYAGLDPLTPQAEDAIVRLAHSKMPDPPCGS